MSQDVFRPLIWLQAAQRNEDAIKIIEEASAIVEESMKEKFPDLPSTTVQSRKTEAALF